MEADWKLSWPRCWRALISCRTPPALLGVAEILVGAAKLRRGGGKPVGVAVGAARRGWDPFFSPGGETTLAVTGVRRWGGLPPALLHSRLHMVGKGIPLFSSPPPRVGTGSAPTTTPFSSPSFLPSRRLAGVCPFCNPFATTPSSTPSLTLPFPLPPPFPSSFPY